MWKSIVFFPIISPTTIYITLDELHIYVCVCMYIKMGIYVCIYMYIDTCMCRHAYIHEYLHFYNEFLEAKGI